MHFWDNLTLEHFTYFNTKLFTIIKLSVLNLSNYFTELSNNEKL